MPSAVIAGRTSFLPFCCNQAAARDTMNAGIPLFQAFSPIPVQRSTYCDCIKVGVKIDPCCGSGGMFVQSIKFVEANAGNKKNVSVYGQELTNTTYKLAKMNLAIRGISANLGEQAANTFTNDQHKDLKADFIMANSPFNQKDWRA
jgi:hypothetical protein